MIYLNLFIVFFKLGLFSFGGGYAVLSLLQHEVIDVYSWLNISEFTEIVALSQMTPGPISINAATYIGYKLTGNFIGALVPTIAVILPSTILISLILLFIQKFKESKYISRALTSLKPTVIGLILAAGLNLLLPENFINWQSYFIFTFAVCLSLFFNTSALITIASSGLLGIMFKFLF